MANAQLSAQIDAEVTKLTTVRVTNKKAIERVDIRMDAVEKILKAATNRMAELQDQLNYTDDKVQQEEIKSRLDIGTSKIAGCNLELAQLKAQRDRLNPASARNIKENVSKNVAKAETKVAQGAVATAGFFGKHVGRHILLAKETLKAASAMAAAETIQITEKQSHATESLAGF